MSKYLKSHSLISSSYTALQKSADATVVSVGDTSASSTQIKIDGYTQQDLYLFEQLSKQEHGVAPAKASVRKESTAHQVYTAQDVDNFNRLMNFVHPSIAD